MDNTQVKTMPAPMTKKVKPKKHKTKSLDKAKAKAGWFFVLPFVIVFLIIYVPVINDSIRYSFNIIVNVSGGYQLDPVGWENYNEALFVDARFIPTLTTGIEKLILEIPAIVIFSLFMAVLLNQKMKGRALFRAIFFIPVILSTGLVDEINMNNASFSSYAEKGIDNSSQISQSGGAGIMNAMDLQVLFSSMKVGTELVDYVVNIVNNVYDVVNRSGVQMLIFLAGLQSISPAIYESCKVEGATAWETFWKITFPMISPMILVNSIYTIIDSFTSSSNKVMSYINTVYNNESASQNGNVVASAMYWIYFLLVILIIAAVASIISAYVFYQRRD